MGPGGKKTIVRMDELPTGSMLKNGGGGANHGTEI